MMCVVRVHSTRLDFTNIVELGFTKFTFQGIKYHILVVINLIFLADLQKNIFLQYIVVLFLF